MNTRSAAKETKNAMLTLDDISDLLDEKLKVLKSDVVLTIKRELSEEINKLFNAQSERIEQLESSVAVLKNSVTVLKDQLTNQKKGFK